jgi:hypothetical protein
VILARRRNDQESFWRSLVARNKATRFTKKSSIVSERSGFVAVSKVNQTSFQISCPDCCSLSHMQTNMSTPAHGSIRNPSHIFITATKIGFILDKGYSEHLPEPFVKKLLYGTSTTSEIHLQCGVRTRITTTPSIQHVDEPHSLHRDLFSRSMPCPSSLSSRQNTYCLHAPPFPLLTHPDQVLLQPLPLLTRLFPHCH